MEISTLDAAVANMGTSSDARRYVEAFFATENAWLCAEPVLTGETHENTKFLALRALRDRIRTYWKSFDEPLKQRTLGLIQEAIPKFVLSGMSHAVVAMADMVLVEILKHEWPENLGNFIPELKEPSLSSRALRKNNLEIVTFLADDIKACRKDELSYDRFLQMNQGFARDFHVVMEIIDSVFSGESSEDEINECFVALRHFIPVMGDAFVGTASQVFGLCEKLITNPKYSMSVFALYGEILSETDVEVPVATIFKTGVESLGNAFGGAPTDLMNSDANTLMESFYPFFMKHFDVITCEIDPQFVQMVLSWVEMFTSEYASELRVFSSCMMIWQVASRQMYTKFRNGQKDCGLIMEPLVRLLPVILSHIPEPYEVMQEEEDHGNVKLRVERDTDPSSAWSAVRDTLVFMTHIMPDNYMRNVLGAMIAEVGQSQEKVNSTCRAFEAICGAMDSENTAALFPMLTDSIVALAASVTPNDGIAQPYLFMCASQYKLFDDKPEFLQHCIQMFFSSMKSANKETKTVALFTFQNLAKLCRKAFVISNGDGPCILDQILGHFSDVCSGLDNDQVVIVVGAICDIIRKDSAHKAERITGLCSQLNTSWRQQTVNPSDFVSVQSTLFLLKCYGAVANGAAIEFTPILQQLMTSSDSNLQELYRIYSQAVASASEKSEEFIFYQRVRAATCDIMFNWLSRQIPSDQTWDVLEHCLNFAIEYQESPPQRRVPEVLKLFGVVLSKRKGAVPQFVDIWKALFDTTVPMVCNDSDAYLEFEQPFLVFLTAIVLSPCFPMIISEPSVFEKMLQTLRWFAFHKQPYISLKAINVYHLLLHQIIINHGGLLPTFAPTLMITLFELVTDDSHKFAFTDITRILKNLMRLEPIVQNLPSIAAQLSPRFPNIDFRELLMNMVKFREDLLVFHDVMRDFLVRAKQFSPFDPRFHQAEKVQAQQKEAEFRRQIPGLSAPTTDNDPEDISTLLGRF